MNLSAQLNIKIKVKITDLIDALQHNRHKHIEEYEDAMAGYFERLDQRFAELANDAANRVIRKDNYRIDLVPPVNAEKMYDQYIDMLSMAQDEFMEITTHEYQCFVADEWDWARTAKMTNSFYSTSASC